MTPKLIEAANEFLCDKETGQVSFERPEEKNEN